MKSRYHAQYISDGFKFVLGSTCGCKNYYAKDFRSLGSIVVQVERCKGREPNTRPHKRCPWEWVHAKGGERLKAQLEGDMGEFEEFLKETIFQPNGV